MSPDSCCGSGWPRHASAGPSRPTHTHTLVRVGPARPPSGARPSSSLLTPPPPPPRARRYVISVARKIGATVYLTWEDIVEVKQKMVMMLVASIMHRSMVKAAATE